MINYVSVLNTSCETIPPFALMEPTGVDPTTNAITVQKPSRDNLLDVIVNSEISIDACLTGQGTYDTQTVINYNATIRVPQDGDPYGAVAGSWQAQYGYLGFLAIGTGINGFVNATRNIDGRLAFLTVGPQVNGAYPANLTTLNTQTLQWTDSGVTTANIVGLNSESLTNQTRYLACLGGGVGNSSLGYATVYAVTANPPTQGDNMLINGSFQVNQRAYQLNFILNGPSNSGNYVIDRWFVVNSCSTLGVGGTIINAPNQNGGQGYDSGHFFANGTTAMLVGQVVEASNTEKFFYENSCATIGLTMDLSLLWDNGPSMPANIALLSVTGTVDLATNSRTGLVSSWTGNNPNFNACVTVLGTANGTVYANNTWTQLQVSVANVTQTLVNVGASATSNFVVVAWFGSNSYGFSSHRACIRRAGLYPRTQSPKYVQQDRQIEFLKCQRYYFNPYFTDPIIIYFNYSSQAMFFHLTAAVPLRQVVPTVRHGFTGNISGDNSNGNFSYIDNKGNLPRQNGLAGITLNTTSGNNGRSTQYTIQVVPNGGIANMARANTVGVGFSQDSSIASGISSNFWGIDAEI